MLRKTIVRATATPESYTIWHDAPKTEAVVLVVSIRCDRSLATLHGMTGLLSGFPSRSIDVQPPGSASRLEMRETLDGKTEEFNKIVIYIVNGSAPCQCWGMWMKFP